MFIYTSFRFRKRLMLFCWTKKVDFSKHNEARILLDWRLQSMPESSWLSLLTWLGVLSQKAKHGKHTLTKNYWKYCELLVQWTGKVKHVTLSHYRNDQAYEVNLWFTSSGFPSSVHRGNANNSLDRHISVPFKIILLECMPQKYLGRGWKKLSCSLA